jgi:hypothetical protein
VKSNVYQPRLFHKALPGTLDGFILHTFIALAKTELIPFHI